MNHKRKSKRKGEKESKSGIGNVREIERWRELRDYSR